MSFNIGTSCSYSDRAGPGSSVQTSVSDQRVKCAVVLAVTGGGVCLDPLVVYDIAGEQTETESSRLPDRQTWPSGTFHTRPSVNIQTVTCWICFLL